jgi:hypothetical protein
MGTALSVVINLDKPRQFSRAENGGYEYLEVDALAGGTWQCRR